mmetsp:Transcript_26726/g.38208  ORF Transcript_26726/g.38208 Transcript_26726/m.38208 type:complete len:207 (+) Transcript_26726:517-1137(+)
MRIKFRSSIPIFSSSDRETITRLMAFKSSTPTSTSVKAIQVYFALPNSPFSLSPKVSFPKYPKLPTFFCSPSLNLNPKIFSRLGQDDDPMDTSPLRTKYNEGMQTIPSLKKTCPFENFLLTTAAARRSNSFAAGPFLFPNGIRANLLLSIVRCINICTLLPTTLSKTSLSMVNATTGVIAVIVPKVLPDTKATSPKNSPGPISTSL